MEPIDANASSLTAEKLQREYERLANIRGGAWGAALGNSHMADALQYGGLAQAVQRPKPDRFAAQNMRRQIASRMGWDDPGANAPFQVMEPARLNDQEAVVFIVTDGKAIVIHDDINLFPSDALVTQLRLLTN